MSLPIAFPNPAFADEPSQRWTGWIEAAGYLSSQRDRGELVLFQPLLQDQNSLLFADVRGKLFTEDISEGNFAVGYRELVEQDWILGAWAGFDHRRSSSDNTFNQMSVGFEALSTEYDFRLNAYLPLSDPKNTSTAAQVVFSGSQLYLISGAESPTHGLDSEIGVRLPLEKVGFGLSQEARLFFGGYFFDDASLPDSIIGPRVRTEWRMFDLDYLGAGSRVTLEAEFQHDRIRNTQAEFGIRLRIPLFDSAPSQFAARDPLIRRMTEGLERDTDIVTGPAGPEPILDAVTGVRLDRVITVDATDDVLESVLNADSNSLVIMDGAAGEIVTTGMYVLPKQTLAGGGTALMLKGAHTGTNISFLLPGIPPTLRPPKVGCIPLLGLFCGDMIFVTGRNIHITGLSLDGLNISTAGVAGGAGGGDAISFTVDDVLSSPAFFGECSRGPSFGVETTPTDRTVAVQRLECTSGTINIPLQNPVAFTVENTTIENMVSAGFLLGDDSSMSLHDVTIKHTNLDNPPVPSSFLLYGADSPAAIIAHNNTSIRISHSTISDVNGMGILVNDDNSLVMDNVNFSQITGPAIEADDRNSINLSNSSFSTISAAAIFLSDENTLTLSNGDFAGVGEGINARQGNALSITESQFRDVTDDVFDIDERTTLNVQTTTFDGLIGGEIRDDSEDLDRNVSNSDRDCDYEDLNFVDAPAQVLPLGGFLSLSPVDDPCD